MIGDGQAGTIYAEAASERVLAGQEVAMMARASHEADDQGASVLVALASSSIEAELIAGMLRSNGLTAAVSADDGGGLEPQLQIHGVRVLVSRSDEAAARRLLTAADDARRRPVDPDPGLRPHR